VPKSSETVIYFLLLCIALRLNVISNTEFAVLVLCFLVVVLADMISEYIIHKDDNL